MFIIQMFTTLLLLKCVFCTWHHFFLIILLFPNDNEKVPDPKPCMLTDLND